MELEPEPADVSISDSERRVINSRLKEIELSTPTLTEQKWDDGEREIFVKLPHGCEAGGLLEPTPNMDKYLLGTRLYVPPKLRGHGIGERLIKSLVVQAQEEGCGHYRAHVESEYSLKILQGIFGDHNITYSDTPPHSRATVELPLEPHEAITSLERAGGKEKDLEWREIGFSVDIDISKLDTSEWEHPIHLPDNI